MENVDNLSKAYTEVIEVLNHMPKEESNLVPKCIIDKMHNKMDIDYDFEIKDGENFQDIKFLDETKAILAVLYRDYWATKSQRKKIIKNEKKGLLNNF